MTKEKDLIEKAIKRQVGDVHPNGKWAWTEYKSGKYDWRPIKNKTQSKDSNVSSNQTSSKPTTQQIANAKVKGQSKPMDSQRLAIWATKTSDDNLLKVANSKNGNAQMRKIAYDELGRRNFDMSKVDTSGTLIQLMKMTGNVGAKTNDTSTSDDQDTVDNSDVAAEIDTDGGVDEGDKITEKWYLDRNDDRVKKMFNLKTKEGRIKYDQFVYKMKKKEKDYMDPVEVVQDLNEQYLEFLDNNEQRFMISAGGAGVGKSYGFKKMAELLNLKPFGVGDAPGDDDYDTFEAPDVNSGKQLLNILKAHNNKIIIFDDNDKVLRRSDCAAVMKKATASTGARIVGDPDDIKQNFEFTGRIVIMTNKDLTTLSESEDTKAIISRAMMVSEIYMTVPETIQVIENRYQDFEFKQAPRLDNEADDRKERDEILGIIKKDENNIDPAQFTTRTFQEVLINKRKVDKANEKRKNPAFASLIGSKIKDWREKATAILTKAAKLDFGDSSESSEELVKAEDILLDETNSNELKKAEDLFSEEEIETSGDKKQATPNTFKAQENDFFEEDMTLEKAETLLLGED